MTRIAAAILILFFAQAHGEEETEDQFHRAIGVFAGHMLPYDIYGVRDIYPFWGLRYSHEIWGVNPEWSATFINAAGVSFYTGSLSLAFPETLAGFRYFPFFGGDVHYYHGHTNLRELPFKVTAGFHLGVSPVIDITPNLAIRADLKYNFGPGSFLFAGGGLMVSF